MRHTAVDPELEAGGLVRLSARIQRGKAVPRTRAPREIDESRELGIEPRVKLVVDDHDASLHRVRA
ncbi:hypothetical protein QEV63_09495 [Trueperella pyogenes]